MLDPDARAETLRERGGAISDVAPGEPTADYLDRVVLVDDRGIGAVYLVAVSLISEASGGLRRGCPIFLVVGRR